MFGLDFSKIMSGRTNVVDKNKIAKLLQVNPEALVLFEKSYQKHALDNPSEKQFFELNAKDAAAKKEGIIESNSLELENIVNRIVDELVHKTIVYDYNGTTFETKLPEKKEIISVTNEELSKFEEIIRPQLTGELMKVDIKGPSFTMLLEYYNMYQKEKDNKKKSSLYGHFRQGMDILDLDEIVYEMIGMNPNSIGHWFPQLADAIKHQDFFKIPKTTIIKVPLSMLQLTRIEYESITKTTLDIVDHFCKKVFNLDEEKEYFIKTGTYSSKFDFRNAKVSGAKEVRELGEYLLFIHHQACQMASSLNNKSIYGVSTTNEWVVREFIKDKENNPCIYKGLPLHTEYRIFVNFDTKKIIGFSPYWESKTMKNRFGNSNDSESPHMQHDYIIYTSHEDVLMKRYNDNIEAVKHNIEKLINDFENISGQWSIDIMQNGEDFWIIDMALAVNSALNGCIRAELLNPVEENWIPQLHV